MYGKKFFNCEIVLNPRNPRNHPGQGQWVRWPVTQDDLWRWSRWHAHHLPQVILGDIRPSEKSKHRCNCCNHMKRLAATLPLLYDESNLIVNLCQDTHHVPIRKAVTSPALPFYIKMLPTLPSAWISSGWLMGATGWSPSSEAKSCRCQLASDWRCDRFGVLRKHRLVSLPGVNMSCHNDMYVLSK